MRRFMLWRREDVTGVSGTGVVAEGVIFTDGSVVVRWRGETKTTTVHADMASVATVHLHGGKTRVLWCDNKSTAPEPVTRSRGQGVWEPAWSYPYQKLGDGKYEANGAVDANERPLFEGLRVRVKPGGELSDEGEINLIHVAPSGALMVQVCGINCANLADVPIEQVEALDPRDRPGALL